MEGRLKHPCAGLLLVLLTAPAVALAAQTSGLDAESVLESLGIAGPFLSSVPSEARVLTAAFELGELALSPVNVDGSRYLRVAFAGFNGTLCVPGKPMLPFRSYVFLVPGDVRDSVRVGLISASIRKIQLNGKVLPAPKPLAYLAMVNQTLDFEEDLDTYAANEFFPGEILKYYVGYGFGGYTCIIVWLYPVQYNPVTGEAVVVEKAKLAITYSGGEIPSPLPSPTGVIITTEKLKPLVEAFAAFYTKEVGINTTVVTVEWIDANYVPAEPILAYPGFYNVTIPDTIYFELTRAYNAALALKIISFLRNETAHPGLTYVLLIGDAAMIPPSFYYQWSPWLWSVPKQLQRLVWEWNFWVPTDFFYASTDYDLIPEYAVGRVPFSDPFSVSAYLEKVKAWYGASDGAWVRKIAMSGGYPFLFWYLFGESALATATMKGVASSFNLDLMTRTDENYNSTTIQALLEQGRRVWYFALCHGDGTAMWDPRWVTPLTELEWEQLANATYLATLPENARVPVVASVACMNGAWDEALLGAYQWFAPPSFGEAILMSNGAGVAYLGSARIAWEVLPPPLLVNGVLYADCYGATKLHFKFIEAYNSVMTRNASVGLGSVVNLGYVNYLAEVGYAPGLWWDVPLLTVLETALLGDPALQLPTFDRPYTLERVEVVEALAPDAYVPARAIAYFAEGTLAFYDAAVRTAPIRVAGTGEFAGVTLVRVYRTLWSTLGHEVISKATLALEEGVGTLLTEFDRLCSGLVLVKARMGSVEARLFMAAAGVKVEPATALEFSTVELIGLGMDLVAPHKHLGIYIYIAGRTLATAWHDGKGYLEWAFALPVLAPAKHTVMLRPHYLWVPEVEEIAKFLEATIAVGTKEKLDVLLSLGSVYEPRERGSARIVTLLNGEPVDAAITVFLLTPEGFTEVVAERVGVGEFEVEFTAPSVPGTYYVVVDASYAAELVSAAGSAVGAFTVTGGFARIETRVSALEELSMRVYDLTTEVYEHSARLATEFSEAREAVLEAVGGVRSSVDEARSALLNALSSTEESVLDALEGHSSKIVASVAAARDALASTVESVEKSLTGKINALEETIIAMSSELRVAVAVAIAAAIAAAALSGAGVYVVRKRR